MDHTVCLLPHMPMFTPMFVEGNLSHDPTFDDVSTTRSEIEETDGGIMDGFETLQSTQLKDDDLFKTVRHSVGFIYFNLDYILDIYENMRLKLTETDGAGIISYNFATLNDNFNLLDWIRQIWKGVNNATGNYYNFGISTEHDRPNIVRIIDHRISGNPPKNQIFEFEPFGLRSITRDFYYESQISSKMSSAIAIAALDPNNMNDVSSLSFKAFNRNIISRFTKHENLYDRKKDDANEARQLLEADLQKYARLQNSLNFYLYRLNIGLFEDPTQDNEFPLISPTQAKQAVQELRSERVKILNRYPLSHERAGQWRENTTPDVTDVIPIHINLLMDGIAGLHPLRLFGVRQDRLPLAYRREDIGFVVTKESHKITNSQDWTVSIKGDFYLLDLNPNNDGVQVLDEEISSVDEVENELNNEDQNQEDHDVLQGHFTHDNLTVSANGFKFIQKHEAYRKYAYKNLINGRWDRWTIGWGFTSDVQEINGCEFARIVDDTRTTDDLLYEHRFSVDTPYTVFDRHISPPEPADSELIGELMWEDQNAVIGGRQDGEQGNDWKGGPPGTRSLQIPGNEADAKAQANICLENSVEEIYATNVRTAMAHYGVTFTQNEFDAVVSMHYNMGYSMKCSNRSCIGSGTDSDGWPNCKAVGVDGCFSGRAYNSSTFWNELMVNNDHLAAAPHMNDGWANPRRRTEERELFEKDADHTAGNNVAGNQNTNQGSNYNPQQDPFNVEAD